MKSTPTISQPPSFRPREFIELYARGEYDLLSEKFLAILKHFESLVYQSIDAPTQRAIDAFVLNFLYLFSQADFIPDRKLFAEFIKQNLTISNLVALTPLKTTDAFLETIRHQRDCLAKLLTLFSARNTVKFDRRAFFDIDANLASTWYQCYGGIYHSGLLHEQIVENLKEHYSYQDSRIQVTLDINTGYYGSTYVDGACDRLIKPVLNCSIKPQLARHRIRNVPNPRKIAVLSCLWWPGHSSYRICSAFVESLKGYHLTLFHTPSPGREVDTSLFQEVKELPFSNGSLDLRPVLDNDFSVAYFPDVGMTSFSIVLANLRIAPIMVASLGHSVSSWGSEIDYFVSGSDVEVPDRPEGNYSERLVLLPGCGAVHNRPLYEPVGGRNSAAEFVLNCPWTAQKMNARFCQTLRELVRRAQKPLRFRVFAGSSLNRHADFVPFARDLAAMLAPATVEVVPGRPYKEYMAMMEEGDLTIDAYHFGGCNTVADSLHIRKPIVTWKGNLWYNRIGSQMLRMAGLPELIATSEPEYLDLVLRLIHDDAFRSDTQHRVNAADLEGSIFDRTEAGYFRKAIDLLIAGHDRLSRESNRSAICIARDN
jgi:hypothetical protein